MNRAVFQLFGFIFLCFSHFSCAEIIPLFNGEWTYSENAPNDNKPYSSFDLILNENDKGEIHGIYCFVTFYGNRIDCSPDAESNMTGHAIDSSEKAIVNFYSFFGAKDGIAELSIDNDHSLTWTIIKQPQGGSYYGPSHIILQKIAPKAVAHSGERLVIKPKAYLYDEPLTRRRSKIYVVRGDYVKLLTVSRDLRFWRIKYSAMNGAVFEKWIECQDIDFCAK